jgi:hypothetical protein
MEIIDRGNSILFTATPKDALGNIVTPSSMALTLNYVTTTGRAGTSIVMVNSAGSWTATWESSVAEPGIVYWSARASSPSGAEDGSFELDANPANPEP